MQKIQMSFEDQKGSITAGDILKQRYLELVLSQMTTPTSLVSPSRISLCQTTTCSRERWSNRFKQPIFCVSDDNTPGVDCPNLLVFSVSLTFSCSLRSKRAPQNWSFETETPLFYSRKFPGADFANWNCRLRQKRPHFAKVYRLGKLSPRSGCLFCGFQQIVLFRRYHLKQKNRVD
jgi:hypothetical protein